ncbi:MAG: glycosyl hydrolase family 2 [Prolixibacteraceae bacterium]|jgi:sialate O-acetylesterase|nr:glycosyl hydrolase family 2 [Prolixibacteraceae bacterium]
MKNLLLIAAILLLFACESNKNEISLPAIISNNMVLQQNTDAKLWGWSKAGAEIEVETSWGFEVKTTTNSDGKWEVIVETPSYGGPYTIEIESGSNEILIENVLIGEVWLCSGQSNMEMPLQGFLPNDTIQGSANTIANSTNPNIRMFTVAKRIAINPEKNCVGNWEESKPENAKNFSATAYYFGKKLYDELGIPIGLIHSSWGGTPAEAWTSSEYIEKIEGFENFSEDLIEAQKNYKTLDEFLNKLESIAITDLPNIDPYKGIDLNDSKYTSADFDNSNWETLPIPSLWEQNELPGFDGIVWLQKEFDFDGDITSNSLKLYLGPIDDMDATYLNGVKIGSNEIAGVYNVERNYSIPANTLKKGTNRVAVRIIDTGGGGGIFGTKAPQITSNKQVVIDLGGEWKYLPTSTFHNDHLFQYADDDLSYEASPKMKIVLNQYAPTVLYNGMIEPLLPYSIKGAIWYQGESNIGRGKQYERLFPTMISNWRNNWNQGDFPFYYVQIAPYNYGPNSNEPTAEIRDAQLKTLSLKNTGMVVTMDIGNPTNIHPSNKTDVGERLALWALAKDYNKEIVYSGPIFKKATFQKNVVEIEFDYANSGLVLKGDANFIEIAGSNGKFYPAKVNITGNKIVASSMKIRNAKQIRYAWADDCEPNLFNTEGLPASPFKAIAE